MIKKTIYHFLFAMNIVAAILAIVVIILVTKGISEEDLAFFNQWRMIAAYFVFAFWIWNIIIWSKSDKKIARFFALFFLLGIYTLFYYRIVLKNNWISAQGVNLDTKS
jgi:hypothetical protein